MLHYAFSWHFGEDILQANKGGNHKTKGDEASAVIREPVGTAAGFLMCVRRLIPELDCYVCVWTSSLSVFAPSFTLAPIPQGLDAFPSRWRLIRGQLVRDTRVIVLTLTVGHWNANREHSKPNGVEEQQIFGQDFFFSFADGAGLFMVDETRLEQMAIRCAEPSFELSANQIKAGSDTCGKKKGRAEADCSISSH